MTMQADGEVKVPPAVQTAAAMVLALVTYTMVYYAVVSIVTVAADVFPDIVAFLLLGVRPNVVLVIAAILGAVAGMGSARLVCDLAFETFGERAVFWMFAAVLGLMTLGKISTPLAAQQMVVLAQYLVAMAVAYFLFWRQEPRPETTPE